MPNQTSEKNAELIKQHASKEQYFYHFTHYNSYYELIYRIPSINFISCPQWSRIKKIEIIETGYHITIVIFEDEYLYDINILLKHPIVDIK